jgi:hypothetical protein
LDHLDASKWRPLANQQLRPGLRHSFPQGVPDHRVDGGY